QSSDEVKPGDRVVVEPLLTAGKNLFLHREWSPEVLGVSHDIAEETWRCDSDDGENMVVERELLTDNVRIFAQLLFPETIADHNHGVRALGAILREHAAKQRIHTEHRKIVTADQNACGFAGDLGVTVAHTDPVSLSRGEHSRKDLAGAGSQVPVQ